MQSTKTLIQFEPLFKEIYQIAVYEKKKPKAVAMNIVAKKLVHITFKLLKSKEKFNPHK